MDKKIDRKEIVRKIQSNEPLTDAERQDVFCDHILHDDYDAIFCTKEVKTTNVI